MLPLSNTRIKKEYLQDTSCGMLHIKQAKNYLFVKRLMDIIFSFIGIIVLAPVFLIVAMIIKLEDRRGPVFFSQVRVGKNEKMFTMYKFRSMVSNAEDLLENLLDKNETTGAMFKMKNDPRITKIGKFIRKTSIDELPQLINVLKGEMSLVGPRPPLPREVKEYTDFHKQRLLVKPGCTGLWQIKGRSTIGFEKMVDLDIQYINKNNIFFDLYIILSTFKIMIFSKDAF